MGDLGSAGGKGVGLDATGGSEGGGLGRRVIEVLGQIQ